MTGIKWVMTVTTFLCLGSFVKADAYNFCQTPNPDYLDGGVVKPSGDWLPWPFGSECVTPWRKLEGTWIRPQDEQVGKISFDVMIYEGARFLTVKRYDKNGSMVDEGFAEVQVNDKIILVKMSPANPDKSAYALFIRHYPEKGTCEESDQMRID